MRVKYESAWFVACYGASVKCVKLLLRKDNPRVPARKLAKAYKELEADFKKWQSLFEVKS